MGLNALDENFWNAARQNLVRFADIREWWQVAQEQVTPEIADPGFTAEAAKLLPAEPWDLTTWQNWTSRVKETTGRKGKELFMPLRLALTGRADGPELKPLLPLIGAERARARLSGKTA